MTLVQRELDNGAQDLQAQVVAQQLDKSTSQIHPQEECTFIVTCVAPQKEGICTAEFGLETEDGERFGDTIQCFFSVPKLEEDKQAEDSLLLANRGRAAAGRQEARSRSRSPNQANMASSELLQNPYRQKSSDELVTPKQIYIARIQKDAITDSNLRDGLDDLFDMGFTNYDVNLALMNKYQDKGAAAEHLVVHGEQNVLQRKN